MAHQHLPKVHTQVVDKLHLTLLEPHTLDQLNHHQEHLILSAHTVRPHKLKVLTMEVGKPVEALPLLGTHIPHLHLHLVVVDQAVVQAL